jgi:serine/threonine protein phosphatase PrpC
MKSLQGELPMRNAALLFVLGNPRRFYDPNVIFVDPGERIYVAHTGNSRIVRIDDMTGAGWTEY